MFYITLSEVNTLYLVWSLLDEVTKLRTVIKLK